MALEHANPNDGGIIVVGWRLPYVESSLKQEGFCNFCRRVNLSSDHHQELLLGEPQ